MFQMLIVYYIVLSLWFDISMAVLIVGAFTDTDGRWICIVQEYLLISSQFAWYIYITAIVNFSLLFTICLTRVTGGTPLSKRSRRCVECICIQSAVTTGLTVASIEQIYNHVRGRVYSHGSKPISYKILGDFSIIFFWNGSGSRTCQPLPMSHFLLYTSKDSQRTDYCIATKFCHSYCH